MDLSCSLILLSGGKGTRFGNHIPKQYLPLQGTPVVLHALNSLLQIPEITEIVVVCNSEYEGVFQNYKVKFAQPGDLRQASVFSGLQQVTHPWVCIHDGARPFIYPDEIKSLIHTAQQTGAATLASEVPYTIKQRHPIQTLNRDNLAVIHTPQCLKTEVLRKGLEQAQAQQITLIDDTQAAELMQVPVALVPTKHPHIKITYPEDLTIAQALLS